MVKSNNIYNSSKTRLALLLLWSGSAQGLSMPQPPPQTSSNHHYDRLKGVNRRSALIAAVAVATTASSPALATLSLDDDDDDKDDPLLHVALGRGGEWQTPDSSRNQSRTLMDDTVTMPFWRYLARFLVHADPGVATWSSHDDDDEQQLNALVASVAASFSTFSQLFHDLHAAYPAQSGQLELLFALLPPSLQPVEVMLLLQQQEEEEAKKRKQTAVNNTAATLLLSTEKYRAVYHANNNNNNNTPHYTIEPPIPPEYWQSLVASSPLSSSVLTRPRPVYGPGVYALLGGAGAAGCALTHTAVIPLDVVKTRAQQQNDNNIDEKQQSKGLLRQARQMYETEGPSSLWQGAQATIAGYFWYGLSVYPTYTAFKRWIPMMVSGESSSLLLSSDQVALLAGAVAAVVASLGLCPLEAARIRAVAPDTRSDGLVATLRQIQSEGTSLYAGLPSLLTRQVMFGSIKFLAFERACAAIYTFGPLWLQQDEAYSVLVSLVAGAWAGALSCVVSQPADAVLTYVASSSASTTTFQSAGSKSTSTAPSANIFLAAWAMIQADGWISLFRGLSSRCVWAGSIIAGQFMLYDLFRQQLKVTEQDLSQVFHIVSTDDFSQASSVANNLF